MWAAMDSSRSPLRVDSRQDGSNLAVVEVVGEIDMTNGDRLEAALVAALSTAVTVEVDLGGVSFLDSTAINTLVRMHNRAVAGGRRLVVTRLQPFARDIFEITGLLTLLQVRAASEGAVAERPSAP